MKKLIILGASGHAKVVADMVKSTGDFNIYGFVDSLNPDRKGESFFGSTILGGEDAFEVAKNSEVAHAIVAVSDNIARLDWIRRLESEGWNVPILIHSKAIVSKGVSIDSGSVVMAGAVVQAGTKIGKGCIINTGAIIDHDCQLGEAVHVAPGCSLAGCVKVGDFSMIGVGTSIRDRVNIGHDVLAGAGAVIVSDLPNRCLAYGVPARVISYKE